LHELSKRVTRHDKEIGDIDRSVCDLQQSVSSVKSDTVFLQREMNKQNLILFGLEEACESQENLMEKVVGVLKLLTNELVTIDTVFRIGKLNNFSARPVKIRFQLISHRNIIYDNRSALPEGYALKDDVPFEVRKNHALLFKKKQQAMQTGIAEQEITIDFKRNSIGFRHEKHQIINGVLVPVDFLGLMSQN
jgi:hypothetical protein